jgi:hypothetical protein
MRLLTPALLLLTGCPLLEIEASIEEVCVTYRDIQIEGVAGDRVQHSFTADDLGQLQTFVEQDAEMSFTRVAIRAHGGAFAAVTSARVAVASGDPASTLPTLSIVECDGDCLPDGNTLAIPADTQHSAVEYVATGSLVIDMDLRGQLPAETWTADVDVCMTGAFRFAVEP